VPRIYVTATATRHRLDRAAMGYAELKRRVDPRNDYVAVRLGDTTTDALVLERAGATSRLPAHIFLRVRDVMRQRFRSPQPRPVARSG